MAMGGEKQTLIAVLDDATKRLLYAQLWPGETTAAVMSALQAVFQTYGLPIALSYYLLEAKRIHSTRPRRCGARSSRPFC